MQKLFIKNRKNQKICAIVDQTENAKGLAFVMHGLSANKEESQVMTTAGSFKDAGYTVVRFDTTNTFGESDGNYENATLTNYYQDLEDVIAWASSQPFYSEPFILTGHSFGGFCVAYYAENYPEKIMAVAPISTVISGKLRVESYRRRGELEAWQESGWLEMKSKSKPGFVKRLKWANMEDCLKYDLLPNIENIKVPVLMAVGDKDESTPLADQQILYEKLNCPKEFHVINGAPHTFRDPQHLKELKEIFDQWLKKI